MATLNVSSDVPLSDDPLVNAMFEDAAPGAALSRWRPGADGTTVVTYSLHGAGDTFPERVDFGETAPENLLAPFTDTEAAHVAAAFDAWAAVADIRFERVADGGDIRLMWTSGGMAENASVAGFADHLTPTSSHGPIDWLGLFLSGERREAGIDPADSSGNFFTLIHELGHAIAGLGDVVFANDTGRLPSDVNNQSHTAMSYYRPGDVLSAPTSPMMLDIKAMQHLYGVGAHNTGDTTYQYPKADGTAGRIYETIWDTGGTDTIDLHLRTNAAALDLTPGSLSHVGALQVSGDPAAADFTSDLPGTLGIAEGVLIENAIGSRAADRLTGNDAANSLNGYVGDDLLRGGAGDDLLIGHYGDDTLEGGAGTDTAKVFQRRAAVTVEQADGTPTSLTVDATVSPEGTDTLRDIERITFHDGTLAFDIEGNAGQAYRIYKAAFDRAPDEEGLGYWIDEMDGGFSLQDVAGGFVASEEFATLFGANPGTDTFIARLYNNVLNRDPDAEGFAYWRGEMAGGMSRPGVLASFSESAENKANVAGQIDDGIWFV